MSFDKFYPNRKDHRKQYYGCRSFDSSCRSYGGCPYYTSSKLRKKLINDITFKEMMEELFEQGEQ